MAKIWRDDELSLQALSGKRIAIVGFGSQGRAHALNLRDSGVPFALALRPSGSWNAAIQEDFEPVEIEEGIAGADIIAVMLPESAHKEVVETLINPLAKDAASLLFAHGYTPYYEPQLFRQDLDILLVAPKAIGPQLRRLFIEGSGAPALVAAEPGNLEIAKAYAKALGCGRAAVIESAFKAETETDLFGEQAVLCGGMPALAAAAFQTLVEAGYEPEVAYFECIYELKLIADLIFDLGIAGMVGRISDTAQFGAMKAWTRIANDKTLDEMQCLIHDIQTGTFAESWRDEQSKGKLAVEEWRRSLRESLMEKTFRNLDLRKTE